MYRVINKTNNEIRHMTLGDVLEIIGKTLDQFRQATRADGIYEDENYIVGQMGKGR